MEPWFETAYHPDGSIKTWFELAYELGFKQGVEEARLRACRTAIRSVLAPQLPESLGPELSAHLAQLNILALEDIIEKLNSGAVITELGLPFLPAKKS